MNHRIQAARRSCENAQRPGCFPSDTGHFEQTPSYNESLAMIMANIRSEVTVYEAFNTFGLFALLYQISILL